MSNPQTHTGTDPTSNLDEIEEALQQSRGEPVLLRQRTSPAIRKFAGWKLDLIKKLTSDERLKPDSFARVGIAMVGYVNSATYEAFPSEDTIAEAASVSKSTVKKAIKMLAELGYFVVRKRGRGNLYDFQRDLDFIDALAMMIDEATPMAPN